MTTPNKNQYGTQGSTSQPSQSKSTDVKSSGIRKDEPASQNRQSGLKNESPDRKSY